MNLSRTCGACRPVRRRPRPGGWGQLRSRLRLFLQWPRICNLGRKYPCLIWCSTCAEFLFEAEFHFQPLGVENAEIAGVADAGSPGEGMLAAGRWSQSKGLVNRCICEPLAV